MPWQGHLDIVKALHRAGADLDQDTSCSWFAEDACATPLDHARLGEAPGCEAIVAYLEEHSPRCRAARPQSPKRNPLLVLERAAQLNVELASTPDGVRAAAANGTPGAKEAANKCLRALKKQNQARVARAETRADPVWRTARLRKMRRRERGESALSRERTVKTLLV